MINKDKIDYSPLAKRQSLNNVTQNILLQATSDDKNLLEAKRAFRYGLNIQIGVIFYEFRTIESMISNNPNEDALASDIFSLSVLHGLRNKYMKMDTAKILSMSINSVK